MKAFLTSADGVFILSPKVTTIGREGCDLMIKSLSVEAQHAFIEYNEQEQCYVLQDLNTAQGTYVNDCRVQNAAVRLAAGDTVRFGYAGQPYQLQIDAPTPAFTMYTPVTSQRPLWSQSPPVTLMETTTAARGGTAAGGVFFAADASGSHAAAAGLPSIGHQPAPTACWIPGHQNTLKPYPSGGIRSRPLSAGSIRRPGPSMSPGSGAKDTQRSVTGAWVAPPLSKPRTLESQETNDQLLLEKELKIVQLNQELTRLSHVQHEVTRKNMELGELRGRLAQFESLPGSARTDQDAAQLTYRVNELEEEVATKMSENAILKAQLSRAHGADAPDTLRRELGERQHECQTVRTELERTRKDKDITSGLVTQMQRDMTSKDNTISRLTREIENQKRELREHEVQLSAITAKFSRVKESGRTQAELVAKEKELLDLRSKYHALELRLKESADALQTAKDEYRKVDERSQGCDVDISKLRKEVADARKELTDVQRGERVVRVDLETTSKRLERFRNRVVQVTFSTPGIKCPDGEISDDTLIDTLKQVVDERTSLHRKLADMKDEVKLAGSSKKELLDKLAKLKGFLKSSRERFSEKGRLGSQIKAEITLLESVILDESLVFIKDHIIKMMKDELLWEQNTEGALEKCGLNVKLSVEHPAKHIESLCGKWKQAVADKEAVDQRLNAALIEHQRQLDERQTLHRAESKTAVNDAAEKVKLEYEEKLNKAIDEIRAIELEKRESAISNEQRTISELEENLGKLRMALAERDGEESVNREMTRDVMSKAEQLEKCEKQLREELSQLQAARAKDIETWNYDKEQVANDYQRELASYKEQINQHSVTICAMEERLNKVMKKNKELNNDVSNLKQQNQQLRNQPPPARRTQPEPPAPKPQVIVERPNAELRAMDQTICLLRQENDELKRKLQEQNAVVVGLRRDLAGAAARLSDMTGELSDFQKEELEKNKSELHMRQHDLVELRQQLAKVSHIADKLTEEVRSREAEIGKQRLALTKLKNLTNDKENRINELEERLASSSEEQKKQLAVLGEEGRITSELTALGAQCRGERHEQVIGRQREALAELRTRIKGLETARPNFPSHDQALQQVVLLKKELAEIRAQQALAENALDGASILDREVNKARGMVLAPNFDVQLEKSAHNETMAALDESEKSYLVLLRTCASCLEVDQCLGLRSMAHISHDERRRLADERDSMCQELSNRIKMLKERLSRKEDLLQGYEMDLAKLRQAEELARLREDQVDGLATDVRGKTEEAEYLRELLKRTKTRLDQEKRLNTAIKQKKALPADLDNVEERPSPPRHHCPVEDVTGRASARQSAHNQKLRRKNYEIATLKKELGDRENQLCKTTARLVSVQRKLGYEDIEAL